MKNAALSGKPYAGNPHVRFDEGEVASAKPRRGSLLYNLKCVVRKSFAVLLVVAGTDLRGSDFSVATVAGSPRMHIDGAVVSGTAVMPSPRVPPLSSVDTLKKFDAVGIRFFSDVWTMRRPQPVRQWWLGEGKYDFLLFDNLVRGMLAATSTGYIIPRIKLEPPDGWISAHMDQMCVWEPDTPGKLRRLEVRPDSESWRALYRRMLRDMVAHVKASDYADRIAGYHIGAFHCGEWHVYPAPNIDVPISGQDPRDPLPPWETTVARRAFFDKWSNAIADDLIDAAGLVRRLTDGKKLIGAFFGYWGMTHERLHRVLASGQVDFFAAPPDYGDLREPGHPGRSQAFCQGSFRLHGRMFYEESDFRTSLSDFGDGLQTYKTRSMRQTVGILRRTIGKCLTGGWENWWFLLGGNRSFDAPEMMETIRRGVELSHETLTTPWRPAEVAVFTAMDEYFTSTSADATETFAYPIKNQFHEEQLPRAGVPFDSYDLADIDNPRLPDYRVYVFPNPFSISEERRHAIRNRVRRAGKTAIWVYAPGYFRNGVGSAANVSDLTGLEIKECFPVADGPYSRRFSAKRNIVTLEDGSRSVYFPLPPKANELRESFRVAGVHVWIDTPDTLVAGRGFVMIHAGSDGEKVIRLPIRATVEDVFGESAARRDVCEIRESLELGDTRVYRFK